MLRLVTTIILFVSLLAANLCFGADYVEAATPGTDCCSISSTCNQDKIPCHDSNNSSHGDHCCDTHTHVQALIGQHADFFHPLHAKQFTAVIPHLFPQDFSRIPFIPPRTIS